MPNDVYIINLFIYLLISGTEHPKENNQHLYYYWTEKTWHTCTRIHTHVHAYTYAYIRTHPRARAHTHTHTRARAHTQTRAHAQTHAHAIPQVPMKLR